MSFTALLKHYEQHLLQQVLPFWAARIDWEHGGILNCVSDDGVQQSEDKFLWSQGRALWTFSALYRLLDARPAFLNAATNLARFIVRNGRDHTTGAWVFRLSRSGATIEGPKSVYVDAFVLYGLTEYVRATGDAEALDLALRTYERVAPLLSDQTTLPTAPHPIPAGTVSHGPSMIFALVFHELGLLTGRDDILASALDLAETVMTWHLRPARNLLHEFVGPQGELLDSDAGKTFIAGHAIESMWFMERIYAYHGKPERVALAMEAVRWHLERGWDHTYGGLFLASHCAGGTPAWHNPQAKVWWPHTEALYALLRAHAVTGQPWCMSWYWRVHDYAFTRFPHPECGDWYQNLGREGRPIPVVVKGLSVKDPFHLPRALLYSILALRGLAAAETRA